MITIKALPNGTIPISAIKDPVMRNVVMRQNENILSLAGQLKELQNTVIDMQRRKV